MTYLKFHYLQNEQDWNIPISHSELGYLEKTNKQCTYVARFPSSLSNIVLETKKTSDIPTNNYGRFKRLKVFISKKIMMMMMMKYVFRILISMKQNWRYLWTR